MLLQSNTFLSALVNTMHVAKKKHRKVDETVGCESEYLFAGIAKAATVQWYGHALSREEENVLMKALNFEVNEKR